MNKNKKISLTKYLNSLMDRLNGSLSGAIPEKHLHRPDSYKQYLTREIATIKNKLEADKLEGNGK